MAGFDLNTFKDFNAAKSPALQPIQTAAIQPAQVAAPSATASTPQKMHQTEIKQTNLPKTINASPIKDEFVKVKKNRGLFEKVYDFTKNITGLGHGYKKLEYKIEHAAQNNISEAELKNAVDKYKRSNENARQTFGDVTSGLASLGTYFGLTNMAKKLNARYEAGALESFSGTLLQSKKAEFIKRIVKSTPKTLAVTIPIVALVGGFTKYITLKINRIGSKEFDYGNKKELGNAKYKEQKAIMKSNKRVDSFKNFFTGMLNGVYAPLAALTGGIVGAPAYLAATTGTRYLMSNKEDKSLADFGKDLADNAVFNAIAAATIAVPAFRRGKYQKVLTENLSKVVKNLKGRTMILDQGAESTVSRIGNKLAETSEIQGIMRDSSLSIEQQIQKLTDENIFFVKIKQISAGSDDLTIALREKCPATRTLEQAQGEIQTALGDTRYVVRKLLGVGTIAETYLAKDSSGKEVAIKMVKKGITREKILADKQKLINLVTNGAAPEALSEEQKYFVRNIDNLAESVLAEVNLQNEANAAKELAKVTKKANLVKPIEVKNGVYVMEKAEGISLGNLAEYFKAKDILARKDEEWVFYMLPEHVQKSIKNSYRLTAAEKRDIAIKYANETIEKVKKSSPDFADFDISHKELRKLLSEYASVQTEQFVKLNRNGKIIHGDIHPGNIFIDIGVLKGTKKGKMFTLIDTGNTITLNKEQAKHALRLTAYIENGNYKDLAKMVTEDAILPAGLTKEKALEYVEGELKKYFTDNVHGLNPMSLEELNTLTDHIFMGKGIISGNSQLALAKAKQSALNSFTDLVHSFGQEKFRNAKFTNPKDVAVAMKDGASILLEQKSKNAMQGKMNLLQMSPKEAWRFLRNKNMLPTNSVEYLTYKFKQSMPRKTLEKLMFDIAVEIRDAGQQVTPQSIVKKLKDMKFSDELIEKILENMH